MKNIDISFDKLLKIKTSGRTDNDGDVKKFPYEPTPYLVLERLANTGYLNKKNTLLDYGCGKGRVDVFLTYQTGCRSVGVEYDERLYLKALNNIKEFKAKAKISFVLKDANIFNVPSEIDRCYFFNPFCVETLANVVNNIITSYNDKNREILFFFYYPSDKYLSYLNEQPLLQFVEEINCEDLFNNGDKKEKIIIYKIKK